MIRNLSIILGVSAALFSHIVLAGAGWTEYVTVSELVPTARHYYEVRLPVKNNPSGCKNKSWFYQDYGSQGADYMFKALLEGIKSDARLRVYVTGNCNIDGYSEISSVSITS